MTAIRTIFRLLAAGSTSPPGARTVFTAQARALHDKLARELADAERLLIAAETELSRTATKE